MQLEAQPQKAPCSVGEDPVESWTEPPHFLDLQVTQHFGPCSPSLRRNGPLFRDSMR